MDVFVTFADFPDSPPSNAAAEKSIHHPLKATLCRFIGVIVSLL
jgi:hypothetical protein